MVGSRTRSVPIALAFALGALTLGAATTHAGVLDDVKQRKALQCGVNPGLPGFATVDAQEEWSGFDVDYCRAIAAAVLGDGKKVKFVPLTTRERFKALQSGAVDVLVRDTAWTMARDSSFGLTFAGVNYYNGQGFMVPTSLGVGSALQLTGAKVCLETGSATEIAVTAYFKAHEMSYTAFPVENDEKQKAAYEGGLCNVYTGDTVSLYATRLALEKPDDNIVLPEVLSKEPYGPVVLQGDDRWFTIVKWVHFALLNAEELRVNSINVESMKPSDDSDVRQLLGTEGALGKGIGLDNAWAANVIQAVGNYGEIFERNLGTGSKLQIPRGLNALWTNGGIQFAPPVR
jgi:general L-amino acid transport system substrate-binding protein